MRLALIAAVAENGVIGRDNALPWRIPEDLRRFKRLTLGKPVIMGRKTYESIGRPLPGRGNIVITRNPAFAAAGVRLVESLPAALAAARALCPEAEEAMVIGGARVYGEALAQAERLYLTEVHASVAGDARFPPLGREQWRELTRERCDPRDSGAPPVSFVVLARARREAEASCDRRRSGSCWTG